MDIQRPSRKKEKRRRQILIGVGFATILILITVGIGSLEPAARSVERANPEESSTLLRRPRASGKRGLREDPLSQLSVTIGVQPQSFHSMFGLRRVQGPRRPKARPSNAPSLRSGLVLVLVYAFSPACAEGVEAAAFTTTDLLARAPDEVLDQPGRLRPSQGETGCFH